MGGLPSHMTLKHETCPQRPKGAEAHRPCTLCGPGKVNTAVVVGTTAVETTLRSPCHTESSGHLGSTLLAGRAPSPGLLRINGHQALKQDGEEPQASPAHLPTAE